MTSNRISSGHSFSPAPRRLPPPRRSITAERHHRGNLPVLRKKTSSFKPLILHLYLPWICWQPFMLSPICWSGLRQRISSLIERTIPFPLCSQGGAEAWTTTQPGKGKAAWDRQGFPEFCWRKSLVIFFRPDPGDTFFEPRDIKSTDGSSLAHKYVATEEYSNCHIFGPPALQKIKSPLLLRIAALYLRWDIDLNFLSFTLK